MEKFTLDEVKAIRAEMAKAMKDIEAKYNCKFNVGNIRYSSNVEGKFEFAKVVDTEHGALSLTKEALAFIANATSFGLNKSVLGEKLVHLGETYVITGYNSRSSKYPILYDKNGKSYKCSVDRMKQFVKSSRPEFFL